MDVLLCPSATVTVIPSSDSRFQPRPVQSLLITLYRIVDIWSFYCRNASGRVLAELVNTNKYYTVAYKFKQDPSDYKVNFTKILLQHHLGEVHHLVGRGLLELVGWLVLTVCSYQFRKNPTRCIPAIEQERRNFLYMHVVGESLA
jgi:hypothetical protein